MRTIRNVFHVYKDKRDMYIGKNAMLIAYNDLGLSVDDRMDMIVIDGDIVHNYCTLDDITGRLTNMRINKCYVYADESDMSVGLLDFIHSRTIKS